MDKRSKLMDCTTNYASEKRVDTISKVVSVSSCMCVSPQCATENMMMATASVVLASWSACALLGVTRHTCVEKQRVVVTAASAELR